MSDKKEVGGEVKVKFGNKGNVVVGGLAQRFPVTLYGAGWVILIQNIEEVKQFIRDHHEELDWGNYEDPFEGGGDPFDG